MKRDELRSLTKTKLLELATERDLTGRHSMTKSQLIEALSPAQQPKSRKNPAVSEESRASLSAASSPADGDISQSSKKQLIALARERSIKGASSMSKSALIEALSQKEHPTKAAGGTGKRKRSQREAPQPIHAANRRTSGSSSTIPSPVEQRPIASKDLAKGPAGSKSGEYGTDRIVTMVRDPYWLHVYWELTRKSVERTAAALGQHWYTAKPILRLLDVSSDDTSSNSETTIRDIEIHGGVNNWYIDVRNPPGTYRVDIGYLTSRGRFYVLARSNIVTTPRPGMCDEIDTHWPTVRDECERIFAMSGGADPGTESAELRRLFEERLRRPMSSGLLTDFGSGALGEAHRGNFHFEIDAELIVYGRTEPTAKVTLHGEPLQLREDGTFTVRFGLPDGRQIIPAVAQSRDGIEERTIILAVERNTKELEPMIHDGQE